MRQNWLDQHRRRWARGNAHLYVRADAYLGDARTNKTTYPELEKEIEAKLAKYGR